MANIGEPQRIIIAEPVIDPVPRREESPVAPAEQPEPEEVPTE